MIRSIVSPLAAFADASSTPRFATTDEGAWRTSGSGDRHVRVACRAVSPTPGVRSSPADRPRVGLLGSHLHRSWPRQAGRGGPAKRTEVRVVWCSGNVCWLGAGGVRAP